MLKSLFDKLFSHRAPEVPISPKSSEAAVEEALQALAAHRLEEADALLRPLGDVRGPRAAQAFYQLAGARFARDEKEAAAELLLRTVAAQDTHAEAHANLGLVLLELKRDGEAARHFERALALDGSLPAVAFHLGMLRTKEGSDEEAARCFEQALRQGPTAVAAAFQLGMIRMKQSRWNEAVDLLDRAAAGDPADANLAYWLGTAARGQGDHARAQAAMREALRRDPQHVQARWALAVGVFPAVPENVQEQQQAVHDFSQALDDLEVRLGGETDIEKRAQANAQQPFYVAYVDENHRELLGRYGRLCSNLLLPWAQASLTPSAPVAASPVRPPGPASTSSVTRAAPGRRRIGIVSAHVRFHSVWNAIVRGWLEALDPHRFEVHIFHTGNVNDAETDWAARQVHRLWSDQGGWQAWAQVIASERLDVLVYPEIGMDTTVMQLAALRLAPRQLVSWGHPITTGLPTIDGYLSADAFEPRDADNHYTEELLRLPRLGCRYRALPIEPAAPDLAALGVEAGDRVLVSPGVPFKYGPGEDAVLVDVARRCAPCKLLFFEDPRDRKGKFFATRLRAAFEAAGVDFDRHVRFVPWLAKPQFFGLLARADVFLDTIGFSGFNTAMQAVQCATPIVAWEARFMRGRFASAILQQMGLDEWVARDPASYAERAQRLCDDPALRHQVRALMHQRRGAIFDDHAPAEAMAQELLR